MTSPPEVRPAADAVAVTVLRRHLEGLRRAVLTAELALHDLGDPPADPDPLDAMLRASPRLARELRDEVLGRILALPRPERGHLLEVLEAWAAADGSIDHAAIALHCHPNSVRNWLDKCGHLTDMAIGQRTGRFGDLARLCMALRAHRILGGVR